MYGLARALLFRLDAERAHELGLRAIELAYRSGTNPLLASRPADLPVECLGLRFRNPVGLAAGLDKNGDHIDALAALGFGFIEIGTSTPRPQIGNPKPRMFRLPQQRAVINRLGFNNRGVDALVKNIERARYSGVLGVNLGKNKDTPNAQAVDDYLYGLERVAARASYVTINISSPNTAGLRELQDGDSLPRLLGTLVERREQLSAQHRRRLPLLLKIAPDLDAAQMDQIASDLLASGIDGLICTNTTIRRDSLQAERYSDETGGLSGAPLRAHADEVLQGMAERLQGRLPLVGVGGIVDAAGARSKMAAGASLLQFYTGMIYRGPALIGECVEALRELQDQN